MRIDRTLLKQLKDLRHCSREKKHALIEKIPDKYLMPVMGRYASDEEITDLLDEFDKLASNLELCRVLDKNPERVQKKNHGRARILVKCLIKRRRKNLVKKEYLDKYT